MSDSCERGEFHCKDDSKCIRFRWVCDLDFDCNDKSDEKGCYARTCGIEGFRCLEKNRCIPINWVCDGERDCHSGEDEDEAFCRSRFPTTTSPTPETTTSSPFDVNSVREKAANWLMSQPEKSPKWTEDMARVLTALFLGRESDLNATAKYISIRQDFNVRVAMTFFRKDVTANTLSQMALYIHTLLTTCENPRNFYGIDLVKILESGIARRTSLNQFVNPFLYLVLCNVNGLSQKQITSFIHTSYQRGEQEYEGILFLKLLALSCATKHFQVHGNGWKLTKNVADLQRPDGSFGDIYSSALATQALMSASTRCIGIRWDKRAALSYLISHQKEDGSFGDILSTYLVMPILMGRTLLSLRNITCPNKMAEREESLDQLKLHPRERNTIHYNLWIGNPMEISYAVTMQVPQKITFFDVMKMAADASPQFRFEWHLSPKGIVVHSLAGLPNDHEKNTYWTLYRNQDFESSGDNSVADSSLCSLIHTKGFENSVLPFRGAVDQLFPNDEDEIVYWFRHD